MSETQNPDPNKKDIPDLTPDKDAKGGVGGGPPMHRKRSNQSPAPHGGFNLLCGKAGGY